MKDKRLDRREMLGILGSGLLAGHTARTFGAQTEQPEFAALDHIEFYVSNVERSRDFFVRSLETR